MSIHTPFKSVSFLKDLLYLLYIGTTVRYHRRLENVNVSIASIDSIPTNHTIFSTWYGVEPTLGDNCILVVEGEGSGAL